MTEEFGGVHQIERRSGVERRASNWREATDQQRGERLRQYEGLVTALDALVAEMRMQSIWSESQHWAKDLAAIVATHRESR